MTLTSYDGCKASTTKVDYINGTSIANETLNLVCSLQESAFLKQLLLVVVSKSNT